ncbi:hypothetical protein rerp_22570 [Rhodococcus erythropolis]|nr:hypothetical protein rerp_22570 [Rhodococcus erythropolis]
MKSLKDWCSTGLVVDTCVLAHSLNGPNKFNSSAIELMQHILGDATICLILDDTGKRSPNAETSLLYSEYKRTLPPNSFPLVVLTRLLGSQRVIFADRPSVSDRKKIAKLIPKNKKDRAVLGAAVSSIDRFLVSNDFDDFNISVRSKVGKELHVVVLSSDQVYQE